MDFATFERIAQNANPEEGVFARFYDRVVKTEEVNESGFPKFETQCFIEIRLKDNNSEVFDQPASPDKIKRFPAEYARYQLAKKQEEKGTPLEQFAFLTASEVESLKIRGIFTVEALSGLDEEKAGLLKLEKEQDLAKRFVQKAKDNGVLLEWQKKEETYREQIDVLQNKVTQLEEDLKKVRKKEKR